MEKSGLVSVNFRVCCDHGSHKIAPAVCTPTVNAIKNQFNNIVEIRAAKPYGSTEDMCVIGTAMINPSKKNLFKNDLKKLKFGSGNARKIEKVVVILPEE